MTVDSDGAAHYVNVLYTDIALLQRADLCELAIGGLCVGFAGADGNAEGLVIPRVPQMIQLPIPRLPQTKSALTHRGSTSITLGHRVFRLSPAQEMAQPVLGVVLSLNSMASTKDPTQASALEPHTGTGSIVKGS